MTDTNALSGARKYCNVTTVQYGSLIDGYFQLATTYPHEFVSTPFKYNSSFIRKDISADDLKTLLYDTKDGKGESVWGTLDVTRNSYTPTTDERWSGGYAWTITFTTRPGNVPQMGSWRDVSNDTIYDSLQVNFKASDLTTSAWTTLQVADEKGSSDDLYRGLANYWEFTEDDPATSPRDGNQVMGTFGLTFGDDKSAADSFPVQNETTFLALSAKEFKTTIQNTLFGGNDYVDVTRSTSYTRAMGYTYSVVFRHREVGGDLDLFGTRTANLKAMMPRSW